MTDLFELIKEEAERQGAGLRGVYTLVHQATQMIEEKHGSVVEMAGEVYFGREKPASLQKIMASRDKLLFRYVRRYMQ